MPVVIRVCWRTPVTGLITLLLCAVEDSACLKLNVFSPSVCPGCEHRTGAVHTGELQGSSSGLLRAKQSIFRKASVWRICRQFCWRAASYAALQMRWKVIVSHFQRSSCWALRWGGFLPVGSVMCKRHRFPHISAPSQVSIKSVFADQALSLEKSSRGNTVNP